MLFGIVPISRIATLIGTPYWGFRRCRRTLWLPRRLWVGAYVLKSTFTTYSPTSIFSNTQEIFLLEDRINVLEQELKRIKRKLIELSPSD